MLDFFWIALASVFYYKTTKYKQTGVNQLAIFVAAPIVLSPVIFLIHTVTVLLPIYSLVGSGIN